MNIVKYVFIIIFILFHFPYCAKYPEIREKTATPALHILSLQKVKNLIRDDCGSCHTSGLKTARTEALKVFDLNDSDWMGKMNETQLNKTFIRRAGYSVHKKDRTTVTDCIGEELYLRKSKNNHKTGSSL